MQHNANLPVDPKASRFINEFIVRRKMAKLGYTSPFSELSAEKADAFVVIFDKIEEMKNPKKNTAKGGGKRKRSRG